MFAKASTGAEGRARGKARTGPCEYALRAALGRARILRVAQGGSRQPTPDSGRLEPAVRLLDRLEQVRQPRIGRPCPSRGDPQKHKHVGEELPTDPPRAMASANCSAISRRLSGVSSGRPCSCSLPPKVAPRSTV